jgi:hypothetical protein
MRILWVLALLALQPALSGCAEMILASQDAELRALDINNPRGVSLQEQYSFRFLGKYRISHLWLSGTNVRNCHYGTHYAGTTAFPDVFGKLEEVNLPALEHDGELMWVGEDHGRLRFDSAPEYFYGTDSAGHFERYLPICEQGFLSSFNGIGLLIIKPDPAKGTDEWISSAKPVQMNGLTWLLKEAPPKDQSKLTASRFLPSDIETWTLQIPETPYWIVVQFSADLKISLQDHPEEHAKLLDLFHQLVASVKVEPLTSPAR